MFPKNPYHQMSNVNDCVAGTRTLHGDAAATAPAESSKAPANHWCPHKCTCVTQEQCPQPLYLVASHPVPWENFKF